MSLCVTNNGAGINAECLKYLSSVKNIAIRETRSPFESMDDLQNTTKWQEKITIDGNVYIPAELANYTPTTDDVTINTDGYGSKNFLRSGTPSMDVMLKSNPCDFQHLMKVFESGNYVIELFLEDGSIMTTKRSLLTSGNAYDLPGFNASVTAVPIGIPVIDATENSYRLVILFKNVEQFRNMVVVKPAWNWVSLLPMMPMGLNMILEINYEVGTSLAVVMVRERCGAPREGLLVADFVVVGSNGLITPAVTGVNEIAPGRYELIIEKGVVPVTLDLGDYVNVQVKKLTSTVIDEISNIETIIAAN